jgi:uncharacterized membrane protein YphA (DoxX/SURF4 family)
MVAIGAAVLRIGLGAVLIVAGGAKMVGDPESFERVVRGYGIRPGLLARGTALLLPPIELTVGLGLLLGVAPQFTSVSAAILLVSFSAAVGYALRHGYRGSCGCFGHLSKRVSEVMVKRNLVLAALTIPIYLADGGAISLDPALPSLLPAVVPSWSLLLSFALFVAPASVLLRRARS